MPTRKQWPAQWWGVPFTTTDGKKLMIAIEASSAAEASRIVLKDLDGTVDEKPSPLRRS